MSDFIKDRTQDEQTNILAQYLRNDILHAIKNLEGSNLRKLLQGLAEGFRDFNNTLNVLVREGDLTQANALIEEWELAFGIPDDCLNPSGTIEDRRKNLLIKLAGLQGDLIDQFNYVLDLLGYNGSVTVSTAFDEVTYPLTYPFVYFNEEELGFTIVVYLPPELAPSSYPLTYPIQYNSIIEQLQCIFRKLAPANVALFFKFDIIESVTFITAENGDFITAENGDFIIAES
jgi:uncharacterized protein YmfQ (DUF2313 family)